MKSKNSRERRISFLKFISLFVVTVAMILVAVYFNFKIPEKENEILRTQIKTISSENDYQSKFYSEMMILKEMIDTLGTPGQNISYENSLISAKIVELEKNIPTKSSSPVYDTHMAIAKLFVELQNAKLKMNTLEDSEMTIAEYKLAYENCKNALTQTERDLYIARRIN